VDSGVGNGQVPTPPGESFTPCQRSFHGLILEPVKYFTAKKMTPDQVAVFVEERKWEYRGLFYLLSKSELQDPTHSLAFGFAAAVFEGLPIVGLIFTISNRVGAAMWAHGAGL
jgi:hypothetical protein